MPCFFEEYYITNKNSLLSNFFDVSIVTKKNIYSHGVHLKVVPVILTLKDTAQCWKPIIAYHLFFAVCDFVVS